jgi:uncharacterized protein (TIGR03083 family)
MQAMTDDELQAAVADACLALADLLEAEPDNAWDTPSLCEGWRVREVVAHMTMPVRYTPEQFMAELQACGGDFTALSNQIATRDAELPVATLVSDLRDDGLHHWTPPGGGWNSALIHSVIHGLDITVPLGVKRVAPDDTMRALLDVLTVGGAHERFGYQIDGALNATDIDWSYGAGTPITGASEDLALMLCGRTLPEGRITR